ncbi:SRPBCC family protein [Vulcanisaeta thermophila]|uniref:SRPBCC family protein n=1 Tax=Vulcanisaeta thermophila TaxID=867917 RepID=UPI000853320E|nr:carbon monoxide dehydrogenase subunit G [Vulcanisaeta thermophila]
MARIHYEGSFEVSRPRDYVYNFLIDPRNVASAIPGVESVEVIDQDNFRVKATLGVGAIKGTVTANLKFIDKRPPEGATVQGRGSGLQSTMDFQLSFRLSDLGQGRTRVNWVFDGNVGGLVGSMGARVLDPVAQRIINDAVNNLRSKLEGS